MLRLVSAARAMRRPRIAISLVAGVAVILAGLLSAAGTAAAASPAAQHGGAVSAAARIRWGQAEAVPGLTALNKGYNAAVDAVSCWGAGGCAAGGSYTDKHHHVQAFAAWERKGRWDTAHEVPGTAALNQGGNAEVSYLSCARTTVCVAVGTYTQADNGPGWFTSTERDGRWGTAAVVPVPPLNGAGTNVVWCATGGLCVAGGSFTDSSGGLQAWIETQTGGRWQTALEVPGLAALNVGGDAGIGAVTCVSAGNCVAGGQYAVNTPPATTFQQPFVASETNGHWGTAQEVPGMATLNAPYPSGETTAIGCPSAGNCTATGYNAVGDSEYCVGASGDTPECGQAFVVNERHGKWGQAADKLLFFSVLTCPAIGDCDAVGAQWKGPSYSAAALVDETNGRSTGPLVLPDTSGFNAVACASPGYCDGGGVTGNNGPFVISEWRGTWGKAITPAGIPRSAAGTVNAMGCPPKITLCVAGGSYAGPKGGQRAFIVSQVSAR
jgi:hypothetical protein